MKLNFFLCFSLLTLSFANPIWAQKIELVKDLGIPQQGTFYDDPISNPSSFVNINNTMFFIADNGQSGKEIFSSTGTAATTELLVDLNSGLADGIKSGLRQAGNKFFFIGRGDLGVGLYVSDGSVAGTKFLHPFDVPYHDNFYENSYGDSTREKVYFAKYANGFGNELWVSDGTEVGTFVLKDIYPGIQGSNPRIINQLGNTILFIADHPDYGKELWITDGTESGTQLLKDINVGASGINLPVISEVNSRSIFRTHIFNNKLYFNPSANLGLWVSDGTSSGTYRIDGNKFSNCRGFFEFNSKLYFIALLDIYNPIHGNFDNYTKICYTDGTEHGTDYYRNLVQNSNYYSEGHSFGILNNNLFFFAADTSELELDHVNNLSTTQIEMWKFDGNNPPVKHYIFYDGLPENAVDYFIAPEFIRFNSSLLAKFTIKFNNEVDDRYKFLKINDTDVTFIKSDTIENFDFAYDNNDELVNVGGCLLVPGYWTTSKVNLFCGQMPLIPVQMPANLVEGEVEKENNYQYYNGDYYFSCKVSDAIGKEIYKISSDGMTNIKRLDNSGLNLSLYPNPVQSELTLILEENAQYIIVNIFGSELKRGNLFAGSNKIDIRDLPPGNYVLMTKKMNEEVQRAKFTISK